jgi:anti-sigma factor RsiW
MAYADGELAGEAGKQVAEHLEGCARCREEVALHRRVSKQVAQARCLSQESGLDIEQTVMERVRQQSRPRKGWWRRLQFIWDFEAPLSLKWAAVTCTVVLLAVGGISLRESGVLPPGTPQGTAMGQPLEIQVETDLEADVFFFATEEATVVWIEEDDPAIWNEEARQESTEKERPA